LTYLLRRCLSVEPTTTEAAAPWSKFVMKVRLIPGRRPRVSKQQKELLFYVMRRLKNSINTVARFRKSFVARWRSNALELSKFEGRGATSEYGAQHRVRVL
jgi:hypothetical protein